MAFRIGKMVQRGWLDSSVKGCVTGELWLVRRPAPILLDLHGYPQNDLAGCLVSFTNPTAIEHEDASFLDAEQKGFAGDITAVRQVLDPQSAAGEAIPRNALFVEWFSERNGRIIVESDDFIVQTHGQPAWQLTADDERERKQMVNEGMAWFMNRVSDLAEHHCEDNDVPDDPLDEFEWERLLKDSDQRAEQYSALLDKYEDHPDRERLIAREMGWDHLEDLMDADERGLFSRPEDETDELAEDVDVETLSAWHSDKSEEMDIDDMLDPEREGIDWVRSSGRIYHPLCLHTIKIFEGITNDLKQHGYWAEEPTPDLLVTRLQDLVFSIRLLAVKLAGALNSLGYDRDLAFTAGMIVAQLKRALNLFNEAIWHIDSVVDMNDALHDILAPYRTRLFVIRESMLALMDRFRTLIRQSNG